MKSGQKCDDEMLSNGRSTFLFRFIQLIEILFIPCRLSTEDGSEKFDEFLGVLGEKIRLKGWERFRGGLDVKGL